MPRTSVCVLLVKSQAIFEFRLSNASHLRAVGAKRRGRPLNAKARRSILARRPRNARGEDLDALLGVARRVDACCVSAMTKTEYALCAPAAFKGWSLALRVCAPFGDIYLSNLEFIARWRNRRSPADSGNARISRIG